MGAKRTPGTGNPTSDLSNLCLAITEHAPLPIATVERAGHIVRYVTPFCRLMGALTPAGSLKVRVTEPTQVRKEVSGAHTATATGSVEASGGKFVLGLCSAKGVWMPRALTMSAIVSECAATSVLLCDAFRFATNHSVSLAGMCSRRRITLSPSAV